MAGAAMKDEFDPETGAGGAPSTPEPSAKPARIRPKRRRSRPRAQSIPIKKLTREIMMRGQLEFPPSPLDDERPQTRSDCIDGRSPNGERPCPWVGCKHHLYLDINPDTGSIKINFPDLEPWELTHTCALDVAEIGGLTLDRTGDILNLTRERIRQLEVRGLLKLKFSGALDDSEPDPNP